MPTTSIVQPFTMREPCPGERAAEMFVRQFRFPYEFAADEAISIFDLEAFAYRDEFIQAKRVFLRPRYGIVPDFLTFFREGNARAEVFLFLKTVALSHFGSALPWTGFRILAIRDQFTGELAFRAELFSQPPGSRTAVFSTEHAPNVAAAPAPAIGSRDLGSIFGVNVGATR